MAQMSTARMYIIYLLKWFVGLMSNQQHQIVVEIIMVASQCPLSLRVTSHYLY